MVMYANEIETKRKKKLEIKKLTMLHFPLSRRFRDSRSHPKPAWAPPNKVCYVGSMILNDNDDHDGKIGTCMRQRFANAVS